jgi:hypothetical protein
VLTRAALERYFEALKHHTAHPEIEYVSRGEYDRRMKRHREHGVPLGVPSWMTWP